MNSRIGDKEISVSGKVFRLARLRHEWCDFLADPPLAIQQMRQERSKADLFTFVEDICDRHPEFPYHKEPTGIAVLPITTYEKWWDDIGFKVRNRVRKGLKSGVELRAAPVDEDFAKRVKAIYDETPVRQGRKFYHYGKSVAEIKSELSSFMDRSTLVGAYYQGELVGFMKLFQANNVLRTIHIIAKMSHRDKCIMDALIAKAVELCHQRGIGYLQYGSWTDGGIGTFRVKHGFQRIEVNRFFVPLTWRGRLMLQLNSQKPMRERLPKSWVKPMIALRAKWNALRFGRRDGLFEG